MQPVLVTNQYPDLYQFLAALAEAKHSYLSEPKPGAKGHDTNTILLWSPEQHSTLFDSSAKLELVEHYAKKLGIGIVLSAASNPHLRSWGQQLGWKVLWSIPDLDYRLNPDLENYEQEEEEGEEQEAIAC